MINKHNLPLDWLRSHRQCKRSALPMDVSNSYGFDKLVHAITCLLETTQCTATIELYSLSIGKDDIEADCFIVWHSVHGTGNANVIEHIKHNNLHGIRVCFLKISFAKSGHYCD